VHATTNPPTAVWRRRADPQVRCRNLIGHWAGLARATTGPTRTTGSPSLQRQRLDQRQTARRAARGARAGGGGQNRQQDESQTGGTQSFNDNMVLKFTQRESS
jgi:hypothetical protein